MDGRFLVGRPQEALHELDRSTDFDPDFTQTWVKKASVHMEIASSLPQGSALILAMGDFDRAIAIDPKDPDMCVRLLVIRLYSTRYKKKAWIVHIAIITEARSASS